MSATDVASAAVRKDLYYRMLLIRRVEERIKANYHRREMRSPPHLYIGHEAVATGVCAALRAEGVRVETGVFGARMELELVNDGPVTIVLE